MTDSDKALFVKAVEDAFAKNIECVGDELFSAFATAGNSNEIDAAVIRSQTGISLALSTMHTMKRNAQ